MNTQATTPVLESFETTSKLSKTAKIRIAGAFSRSWDQGNYGRDENKRRAAAYEHKQICRDLAKQGIAEPQMTAAFFRNL